MNIIFPTDLLQAISGGILYSSGSAIWIMRSKNRRADALHTPLNPHRYLPWHEASLLPEPLYEAIPFIYILIGILLQSHTEASTLHYAGCAAITLGLGLLIIRHRNRSPKEHSHSLHLKM
ncbi:hypothetical protein IOQ59_05500 [Pontibacterium sp. N1Y112]|uniref:Uncharacterized protein n=1 Tax=Pontibacterium sinense TaxID=2781979 RepID=A0A8J7F7U7_9GAMM|nr:hypothetical protein [Pontibacterium sinense]MBE9396715.1 hypothetical protein [Pontibacterium sinense]